MPLSLIVFSPFYFGATGNFLLVILNYLQDFSVILPFCLPLKMCVRVMCADNSYHILSSSSSLLVFISLKAVFTKMCFCAYSHLLPSTFYCKYKGSVMYCCFKKKKNSKKKNPSKSVEQLKWCKNLEQKRKGQYFLFGHHKNASTVQPIRYRVDITKAIWYPA